MPESRLIEQKTNLQRLIYRQRHALARYRRIWFPTFAEEKHGHFMLHRNNQPTLIPFGINPANRIRWLSDPTKSSVAAHITREQHTEPGGTVIGWNQPPWIFRCSR